MHRRLTDKLIRELPLPAHGGGSFRVWDIPDAGNPKKKFVSGLGVRLARGGTRSFVLRYRTKRTKERPSVERLYTIGPTDAWNVHAARLEAERLRGLIAREGADPQQELRESRDAPTMADLCSRFLQEFVPTKRASTQREYRSLIEGYVAPILGRKLVTAVDHNDIVKLHAKVTQGSGYQANRAVAVLSRMFTLAITRWRWRTDNPAARVERNPEVKRRRYLNAPELKRLVDALARHENQDVANVFRLLLLTGARREEVVSARWEQFDLEHRQIWTRPGSATKTKITHEVPLSAASLNLLRSMRKAAPKDAVFLFPGGSAAGHRSQLNQSWNRICAMAQISRSGPQALRIHDLRHSYASLLASAGFSLPTIGALLGHSQVATTARYSHLFDDVQRAATNKVGSALSGLVTAKPSKRKRKPRLRVVR
jgi:integrase